MSIRFSWRVVVQILIFALLIFLSVSHLKYGIEKAASIDAYCPYGAVESFFTTITTGEYLKRIWTSSFILMGITIFVTLLFGRVFCSFMCPLGAIQEWIRYIGRKIGIKKDYELPAVIDKYARYIKYIFLVLITYYSYKLGDLFFRNYDPYNALMHFGNEFDEKLIAYSILGLIAFLALFTKNWWCRYFCPMGAFLGIIKKISLFKIVRNDKTCVSCGTCNIVCPANLPVDTSKSLRSADCISCLNCVSSCPNGSLDAKVMNKTVDKNKFIVIAIVSFFVPLLIIMMTSFWQSKSQSNIVDSNNKIDVENIRGSNTLDGLMRDTGIKLDVFVAGLGLPADIDTSLKLKDIGAKYGLKNKNGDDLETEDFRELIKESIK